jgi:hypothetical protein
VLKLLQRLERREGGIAQRRRVTAPKSSMTSAERLPC